MGSGRGMQEDSEQRMGLTRAGACLRIAPTNDGRVGSALVKQGKETMALDWERQAVIDELTERINQGAFDDGYDELQRALDDSDALSEPDRQRVLQFWVAKQRERGRRSGSA
jgi:hypothetical protein